MNFPQAVVSGFKHYATFSGRATRSEYWYWVLFVILGSLVSYLLDSTILGIDFNEPHILPPIGTVFELVVFLPNFAVGARRLHDVDISGWWILIPLLPILGLILLIIWTCRKGTEGENRFDSNYISLPNRIIATALIALAMVTGVYSLITERSILADHDIIVDTGNYKVLVPEGFRYYTTTKPHISKMLEAVRTKDSRVELNVLQVPAIAPEKLIEKEKAVLLHENASWRFSEVASSVEGRFTVSQMTMTSEHGVTMMMAVFSEPNNLYVLMFKTLDKDFENNSKIYSKIVNSFGISN